MKDVKRMDGYAPALLAIEDGSFYYGNGKRQSVTKHHVIAEPKTAVRVKPGVSEAEIPYIIKDINISVEAGEVLAVLGPNGSGKTTLLRCMMNMLPWRSGRTLIDGRDVRQMETRSLWQIMAYVPQARTAATSYTAFQTVLLGRSSRIGAFSAPKEEDMEAADMAMKRLGISELSDKPCHELSGGEQQMVLIARALAAEPKILVLDEPESNLDFKNQLIVLDAISALASEGVACIFNTHYPAHALQRADKSLLLTKGGMNIYGPTKYVVSEDDIRSIFGVDAVVGDFGPSGSEVKSVVPVGIAR